MKRLVLALAILLSCVVAFSDETPQRPHIMGIEEVKFFSSNFQASNAFYSPLLAMMQPPATCKWCKTHPPQAYAINGVQLIALAPRPSPAPNNLLAEITFATDDLSGLKRYLEFHKIAFTALDYPEAGQPGKKPLSVTDPEGHRISFVEWKKGLAEMVPEYSERMDLIHAGFVVHDRAAEDTFYRDLLGFHVYWHGGMKDGTDDWVDMQVPDGTDWIEYMLNVPDDAGHRMLGIMNHMAVGVRDIHKAYAEIIARGVKPTEQPKIGRDGKWQMNLYDPDDTRVEFMERTPTNQPCCSSYQGPHPGSQSGTQTKPAAQPNP
jgi:catechol 2,3-dioxygenase-like lactoylglutathione lyase family enzyme